MDVEDEVLEDGLKTTKEVNRQRKQDHVLGKDVTDDCVTDGDDACCWLLGWFCRHVQALLSVFL